MVVDVKKNNSAHKTKQQLYVAIALGSIAVAIGIFLSCMVVLYCCNETYWITTCQEHQP